MNSLRLPSPPLEGSMFS